MNKILKISKLLLPWVISAGFLAVVLRKIDITNVPGAIFQMHPLFFIAMCGVSIAGTLYFGVKKYYYILTAIGINIPLKDAKLIKLGTLPIKAVMPFKSGEFVKAMYLKNVHNVSYHKGIYSIVLGYLTRVPALILFVILGAILSISNYSVIIFVSFALAAAILIGKIRYKKLLLYSFLVEFALLLNYFLMFRALAIKIPPSEILILGSITIFLASIPVSIAGIGVREAAFLFLFVPKVEPAEAVAAGLLLSFIDGLLPVLCGCLFINKFMKIFLGPIKMNLRNGGVQPAVNEVNLHKTCSPRLQSGVSESQKKFNPHKYLVRRQKNPVTKYRIKKRVAQVIAAIDRYHNNTGKITVLDIGAADGTMLSEINSKFSPEEAVGVEPYRELREAQKDEKITIIDAAGENLPFSENRFDIVLITSSLEHVNDVQKVLSESRRVLKNNGWLIITAVSPVLDKAVSFLGVKPDDHLRTYNLKELKRLLVENHFRLKFAEKFGPLFYTLIVGEK